MTGIRMTQEEYEMHLRKLKKPIPTKKEYDGSTPLPIKKGPNKTENEYRMLHLRGVDARFEAITWHMANGTKYTPDWIVFSNGVPESCHEIKGVFRFGSHGRARGAFLQCKIEFSGIKWVWATKTKDGWVIN